MKRIKHVEEEAERKVHKMLGTVKRHQDTLNNHAAQATEMHRVVHQSLEMTKHDYRTVLNQTEVFLKHKLETQIKCVGELNKRLDETEGAEN